MAQVNKAAEKPSKFEIAANARSLMRRALKGSLATVDAASGYPYASLITLATDPEGAPVFLISTLARHTANLLKDTRASILVDATGALADPLQGARVTISGRAEKAAEDGARRRFLARHPEADFYADFPDFSFWRLKVEGAHYIGGFGRIFDLDPEDLLVPIAAAAVLVEGESDIVGHMNEDHADAISLYATALAGGAPGAWRMTGIDPEGCDIVLDGETSRILFAKSVTSPGEARNELVRLANEARARLA
ncbi:MAG: HugZ family protein [Methyloceanibacter sp.]|uniref:HugZ family pyridoxamine 5'-phosphate oxidase n=1 Tax=Methyloceanibacter sp. TaxID=1965321 RepID=UPI003D9BC62C